MGKFKEAIVNECLAVLGRDDVKDEIKELFVPIIDLLLKEIYPYIFLSMLFVVISFLLILVNSIGEKNGRCRFDLFGRCVVNGYGRNRCRDWYQYVGWSFY